MKLIPLALLLASTTASAIVIDKATFEANGGDMSNIANTITAANEKLRQDSFSKPWLAAGRLGGCTVTWLGDDDKWSYFLAASHCVGNTAAKKTEMSMSSTFKDWNGVTTASGSGFSYVPPERVSAGTGAATDISMVKLPKVRSIVDKAGVLVEPPIVNDLGGEDGRTTILVGYGTWGIGADANYGPKSGVRRLYGRTVVKGAFGTGVGYGGGLRMNFYSVGPTANWARAAAGDSGSAIWQFFNKKPVIVAATSSGASTFTNGVRTTKYINWIRSVFPGVRLRSQEQPKGCIVDMKSGQKYCLPAGERSDYALPQWIYGHDVYVQADNGVSVMLSDWDNLSYNRIRTFTGTVENEKLRDLKAHDGQILDFSKPKSMRVQADTTPLGCIVSLTSAEKYCLPAGGIVQSLPSWIKGQDVYVEADAGVSVMLSDVDGLANNRVAVFSGSATNEQLKKVQAYSSEILDFSKPASMRVDQK